MYKNVLFLSLINFSICYTDNINKGLEKFFASINTGTVVKPIGDQSIILPDGRTTQVFQDEFVIQSEDNLSDQ